MIGVKGLLVVVMFVVAIQCLLRRLLRVMEHGDERAADD
jgi:ABC-type enterobactin transport system permease subunit